MHHVFLQMVNSNTLKKTAFITAVLLLMAVSPPPVEVQLDYFKVENQGQGFVVSWKSLVEEDVFSYELTRKTALSNEQFIKVYDAEAHGINKPYSFRDDQVYKSTSENLDYRLQVVYTNGLREVISSKSVNYTSTAIRRTWGSLKAMFQ